MNAGIAMFCREWMTEAGIRKMLGDEYVIQMNEYGYAMLKTISE